MDSVEGRRGETKKYGCNENRQGETTPRWDLQTQLQNKKHINL